MRKLLQPGDRTPAQIHAAQVDPDFMLEGMVRGCSHQYEMLHWSGGTWLVLLPTMALLPLLPLAFMWLLSLPPLITTLLLGETSIPSSFSQGEGWEDGSSDRRMAEELSTKTKPLWLFLHPQPKKPSKEHATDPVIWDEKGV